MGYMEVIDKKTKKAFILIPRKEWRRIEEKFEDFLDECLPIKRSKAAYEASGRHGYPSDVVGRIIDGEHPVKVIREWRKLTQAQLAAKTGLAKAVISHIETGVRNGGLKTLGKIATALDVPIEILRSRRNNLDG